MTALATIIKPGLQTTIQDGGRARFRHLGAPLSGAADRLSLALANAALGNPIWAGALECALTGPSLKFECAAAFSIAGAGMGATLNGAPVAPYQAIDVNQGDELTLTPSKTGARTYIAFCGGLAGDDFLGSVSTYLPARLGGANGAPLCEGGKIYSANCPTDAPVDIPPQLYLNVAHDFVLRATPGPDAAMASPGSLARFFQTAFTANARADRMGLRLTGGDITIADKHQINSSAVFPGTVQCPPDGAPFLLLADAQTTGGYPRLAQLIAADLPLAAQIRPGDRAWFRKTSPQAARDITIQRQALIKATLPEFSFY